MNISIAHPELLNITDEKTGQVFFGGDQAWYAEERARRAGCGPTSAANIVAYLALTRPGLKTLYGDDTMTVSAFTRHMEDLYKFVTPRNMGLNRTELFTEGTVDFAHSRGVSLTPHVFGVASNMVRNRASTDELAEFVKAGLAADCPLGFLNLTRGRVSNLHSWHWITITAAQIAEGKLLAEASDEGNRMSFDLRLWYLSTRLRGGLVYFTCD
jgi:hypothetical protein